MSTLSGVIDLDNKSALANLREFRRELKQAAKDETRVHLGFDDGIAKGIAKFKNDLKSLVKLGKETRIDISARADAAQAIETLGVVKTELGDIGRNPRVVIHVDDKEARTSSRQMSDDRKAAITQRKTEQAEIKSARDAQRQADREAAGALRRQKELGASMAREIEAGWRRNGKSLNRYSEEVGTVTGLLKKMSEQEKAVHGDIEGANKERADKISDGKSAGGDLADKAQNFTDAVGVATAAGVGVSLKVFEEFDRALRNVNSIAQLSEPNLQKLGDSIRKISSDPEIRKGPRELTTALYDVYSVGFSGAKALDVLRESAKGAAAGNTETAVAVDALTGVLNAQIPGAKNARQVMDSLFQTVNDGKVTFPQLAGAIGQTLPFLKAGGVSLQEYGAYMADATAKSQKAEFATNNLNNLISKLAAPPAAAAKAFEALGIKFGFAELKSKGFSAKMAEIVEKTHGSDDALKALFPDMQAFVAAQTIASSKMAGFNAAAEKQRAATEGIGAAARAASKQNQGLGNDVDQAKKNMEEFGLTVATTVVPAVTALLQEGSKLLQGFDSLDKSTQGNIIRFSLYAAGGLFLVGRLKSVIEIVLLVRKATIGATLAVTANTTATAINSAAQNTNVVATGRMTGSLGALRAGMIASTAATGAQTTSFFALRAAGMGAMASIAIAVAAVTVAVWGTRTAILGTRDAGTMSADALRSKWGMMASIWIKGSDALGSMASWLDRIGRNGIIDKLIRLSPAASLLRSQFSTSRPEGDAAEAKSQAIFKASRARSIGRNSYLPSYDVGTMDVPSDQVAEIHKGEIIIPAKHAEMIRRAKRGPAFPPSNTAPRGYLASRGGGSPLFLGDSGPPQLAPYAVSSLPPSRTRTSSESDLSGSGVGTVALRIATSVINEARRALDAQVKSIREARAALRELGAARREDMALVKAEGDYFRAHPNDGAGWDKEKARLEFGQGIEKTDAIKKLRAGGRVVEADVAATQMAVGYDDLQRARAGVEALRQEQEDATASLKEWQEAVAALPSFNDIATEAQKNLKTAFDDTGGSADDLRAALAALPPEVRALEAAPASAQLKWRGLLDTLQQVKAAVAARPEKALDFLYAKNSDLSGRAGEGATAVRDAGEVGLSDAQKLRRRGDEDLAQLRAQVAALSPDLQGKANAELERAKENWAAIVGYAQQFEASNKSSEITALKKQNIERGIDEFVGAFDTAYSDVLGHQESFGASMIGSLQSTLAQMAREVILSRLKSLLTGLFTSALGGLGGGDVARVASSSDIGPRRVDGSFAVGIDRVPRDMTARLHSDETVLSRVQADEYRRNRAAALSASAPSPSGNAGNVTVNYVHNGDIVTDSPADYQKQLESRSNRGRGSNRSRGEIKRGIGIAAVQGRSYA